MALWENNRRANRLLQLLPACFISNSTVRRFYCFYKIDCLKQHISLVFFLTNSDTRNWNTSHKNTFCHCFHSCLSSQHPHREFLKTFVNIGVSTCRLWNNSLLRNNSGTSPRSSAATASEKTENSGVQNELGAANSWFQAKSIPFQMPTYLPSFCDPCLSWDLQIRGNDDRTSN